MWSCLLLLLLLLRVCALAAGLRVAKCFRPPSSSLSFSLALHRLSDLEATLEEEVPPVVLEVLKIRDATAAVALEPVVPGETDLSFLAPL